MAIPNLPLNVRGESLLDLDPFALSLSNVCTVNLPLAEKAPAMNCHSLAQQIEDLQPEASPQDVARLCLLLTNEYANLNELMDRPTLHRAWKETGLRLQLATDQHAAMTQELEDLANSDPKSFTQEQIWVLIRAIKVQSQILQMYVGHPVLDV